MKIIRIPSNQKVVKRLDRQERSIKADCYLQSIQLPDRTSLHKEITRKSNLIL